jgi:hypothetical protein
MRHPLRDAFTIRPVNGVLELVDDTLRFTAVAGGDRLAQDLERLAEKPGLAEQLRSGEQVVALEIPRGEAGVAFSRLQAGAIMKLRARGKTWRFAFYNYARASSGSKAASADLAVGQMGRAAVGAASQLQGRAAAKPWREALRS